MKNRKIAIIDEDQKLLQDLEEILAAAGHEPIVVNDALSAVDIVVQSKPDVILLELRMPRKNGFELAKEINQVFETRRIPIIAMSAFLKDEVGFLFNLCGINKYLRKPFNPLDLIWAIENVAEERNRWDEEMCLQRV